MDYILLGQRIRAARQTAGLSQEKLAEMVGLTSQHISHTAEYGDMNWTLGSARLDTPRRSS